MTKKGLLVTYKNNNNNNNNGFNRVPDYKIKAHSDGSDSKLAIICFHHDKYNNDILDTKM